MIEALKKLLAEAGSRLDVSQLKVMLNTLIAYIPHDKVILVCETHAFFCILSRR